MPAMNQTLNLPPPCLGQLGLQSRKESCLFFVRRGMVGVCYSIVSQGEAESGRCGKVLY